MTLINDNKDENNQLNSCLEVFPSNDDGQILHLKRLLVTLKQHYEKNIQNLHVQLQAEQNQRIALQKDLENSQRKALEFQNQYENSQQSNKQIKNEFDVEVQSLQDQLSKLKEILNKTQEDNKLLLNRQSELSLMEDKNKESENCYRQDLETIKTTFIQGVQEAKAIENRYIDVLNEKVSLEYKCKNLEQETQQLNGSIEQLKQKINDLEILSAEEKKTQGLHIESLQIQIETNEREKQQLEYLLNNKQNEIEYALKQIEELHREIEHQSTVNALVKEQDSLIQEQLQQLQAFEKDYQHILDERDQLRIMHEDSENRLKVSQQHLAKKVKEATLLAERIEEQEVNLNDLLQMTNQQKNQIFQLQGSVDFFEKEEKRLQDQLNETLKVTEVQVEKWKEKYSQLYEKWQNSEESVRKLKKIEDKYDQMKSILANLGAFVGNGININPSPIINSQIPNVPIASEAIEPPVKHIPKDFFVEETIKLDQHMVEKEEKIDLFGMRQSSDYYKQNFLYER